VDVYEWNQWFSRDYITKLWAGWCCRVESVVLRLQSVAEIFALTPPLGLEPATHTSEALTERYLNGSQRILGNYSFRPSISSSLIALSQIHCPGVVL
jgi:hypothetical protein